MDLQVSNDKLCGIQEKIIKTDEVIRLLDVKKKEVNKLDKKYNKLLEKFCTKSNEVLNLQKECLHLKSSSSHCTEIHLSWGKEITELKIQKELLELNHNKYVNTAENKYQTACQEIVSLTETCNNYKKKIEKLEENKAKNVKKIQESLLDVKDQFKDSIRKYEDLKSSSDETISNLKQECNNLEEKRNEALKQLAKARLDCDELRKTLESNKNSPTKSKFKLQQKIETLKTEIQALEIDRDIISQSHENIIEQLKKDNEKEKKIFEEQLRELNNKVNQDSNDTKDNQAREKYFSEQTEKHESEKKFLEGQIKKLKSQISEEAKKYENESKVFEDQLKDLKNKFSEEAAKVMETSGTQTDYEDIYNLNDILTEMHSLPPLMSPLNLASIVKPDTEEDLPQSEPSSFSVAVGTDDIIPTFMDSFTQTCDIINEKQNKIKIKTFDLYTKAKSCSVATETSDFVSLTDSFTQTSESINNNEIEFKSFTPSIIIPKNNVLEEIPKNIKLKSRITKKYKNNKNRLLSTLRNSKLNLKGLLIQYINTCNKFVFVSPSILKSEFKSKIPETEDNMESCANLCCHSRCQHALRLENSCSCSLQQNICANRLFGQFPVYQVSCKCNRDMFCKTKNPNNYHKMRKHFTSKYKHSDDVYNSSDSEVDDNDLQQILREYKRYVIQKYMSDEYSAKIPKKRRNISTDVSNDVFINNIGKSRHREKLNNKSQKSKQYIFSSDSDDESDTSKTEKTSESNKIFPYKKAKVNIKKYCGEFVNPTAKIVLKEHINSTIKENETLPNKKTNNQCPSIDIYVPINNAKNCEEFQNCSVSRLTDQNISETLVEISIRPEENVIIRTEETRKESVIIGTEGINNSKPEEIGKLPSENIKSSIENIIVRPEENVKSGTEEMNNKRLNETGRIPSGNSRSEEIFSKTIKKNNRVKAEENIRRIEETRKEEIIKSGTEEINERLNEIGIIPSGSNSTVENTIEENIRVRPEENIRRIDEIRKEENIKNGTEEINNRLNDISIIPNGKNRSVEYTMEENIRVRPEENMRRIEQIRKEGSIKTGTEEINEKLNEIGIIPSGNNRSVENTIEEIIRTRPEETRKEKNINNGTEDIIKKRQVIGRIPSENSTSKGNISRTTEGNSIRSKEILRIEEIRNEKNENNKRSCENSRTSIETNNRIIKETIGLQPKKYMNTETEEVLNKKLKQSNETTETVSNNIEENIQIKTMNCHLNKFKDDNPEVKKTPFILSKKQKSLLRKVSSLKNGIQPKKSTISSKKVEFVPLKINSKRKLSYDDNAEYKKQKLDLFGTDSDSDATIVDECEVSENVSNSVNFPSISNKTNTITETIKNQTSTTAKGAFKKPTKFKTSMIMKHIEPSVETICKSMQSDSNKLPSLLKNEMIPLVTEKTEKVFKRPQKSKFECPSFNNTKTENCQSSLTETTSKCKKKNEITVQEIENLQRKEEKMDLALAQKLIRDAVTKDWEKGQIATIAEYFQNKNPVKVARLIVQEAMKDPNRVLDRTYTPPLPLLTVTQQKYLVLLRQLEKKNLRNISTIFLSTVETRLFTNVSVEVMEPLVRLYVVLCKVKRQIQKVRNFCCSAAYYMGDLILPLMFTVLTMWSEILPHADKSEDDPLVLVLVQVIHSKTCSTPGYNAMNVIRFLSDCFGYKRGEQSNDEIMNKIFRSYSEKYSKTAYTAIIILCKNMNPKWTYHQIKNHLLPLIETCNNAKNKSMTIFLIKRLTGLLKNFDRDHIIDINNCLSKHEIKSD